MTGPDDPDLSEPRDSSDPTADATADATDDPTDDAADDPLSDPAWRAHLFAVRDEDQLGAWARSLRWFRICRATPSPFLKEPDRLVVALGWRDTDDLVALVDALGLDREAMARPGWYPVGGHRVRAQVTPGRLELAVSGAEQRRVPLTDRDIEVTQDLEDEVLANLPDLADRVIDPPVDGRSCISPRLYPRLFDARHSSDRR